MWFRKKIPEQSVNDDVYRQKLANLNFEIAELYRMVKKIESSLSILELELRTTQNKFKGKKFTEEKEENKTDSFKFINPFKT